MGLWFEQFRVGQCWTSPPLRVTQRKVNAFARLTGDNNPLHLHARFATTTVFGRRISHGLLGLSLALGMVDKLKIIRHTVLAFAGLRWNFIRPVYPGDKLRLKLRVIKKQASKKPDRGRVWFQAVAINQNGEVVQEGTCNMLIYTRSWNGGKKNC